MGGKQRIPGIEKEEGGGERIGEGTKKDGVKP